MALPIFDQISLGLQFSMGSFLVVFFAMIFVGMLFLTTAGWTVPLGMVLISGGIFMTAWAGYATYGTVGLALIILGYVLIVSAYALIRR